MNLKEKGRSWAGDIYHKIEAFRQEVDDFVTKDTVKYVENQVQTVGEGVRNICSYVLHDFLPPVAFNAQSQSQVSKKQINAVGNYARSAFGLEGKHILSRKTDSCKEQGSGVLLDCNDHQRQLSHLASEDIPEKPGTGLSLEDAVKNITEEKCSALRDLSSGDSPLLFDDREEHSFTERSNLIQSSTAERELTLNSLESKTVSESLEISDAEDKTSATGTIFSAEDLIVVVESETNQACETVCNTECIPELQDSTSALKPDCVVPFYKMSETGAQATAATRDIPVIETTCSSDRNDSSGLASHLKEHHMIPVHLRVLQDDYSLSNGLKVIQMDETMQKNLESYNDTYFERQGIPEDFDVNLKMKGMNDKTVVLDCKSRVSVRMGEKHLTVDGSNTAKNKFSRDSHSTGVHHEDFVYVDGPPVFQEAGREKCISVSSEAGSDLTMLKEGDDNTWTHSNLIDVENQKAEECAVEIQTSYRIDEWSSDLCLTEVHEELEDFSPLPDGISFITSPVKTDELPSEGETLCRKFSDVLGISASAEALSSCFSCKQKHADNHFDNKVGIPNPSSAAGPPSQIVNDTCESIGTVPFGESLVDEYKHCCRATQLQPDMCILGGGGDDSAVDIDDPNMETIDLTDKVKLDESAIMVDNQLVYAASCRPRRFRSYKRLIQDAFASRKRLIKEYEQLGIMYGDTDADTSLQPKLNDRHPAIAAASHGTASQTCDSCEPDWEMV